MISKSIIVIVSDLHLGGGASDPGDDHVYQDSQFRKFIDAQGETTEGQRGQIELIINGDFLEFAQVRPEVYALGSSKYWCSEEESLQKLEAIIYGHADIFEALKQFQTKDNCVTIAAGNHDVDLYWPQVQHRLRQAAGPVGFELGSIWYSRYGGRLAISHGHMFDPANVFNSWQNPVLMDQLGTPRLEMCPGTLFMVKFVNWLEQCYPFADNIKPVTALGRLLLKEDRFGLATVGWMFSRFMARHPTVALGAAESAPQTGEHIRQAIAFDERFAEGIVRLYRMTREKAATIETVRKALNTEQTIFEFLYDLLPKVSPEDWLSALDLSMPVTLGMGDDARSTLTIVRAQMVDEKTLLGEEAARQLLLGRQVVVLGHTHQPDQRQVGPGEYFNPGSWTRYAEASALNSLTLEDLKREEDFPYKLSYVRVEEISDHGLQAEMICSEEKRGFRYSPNEHK